MVVSVLQGRDGGLDRLPLACVDLRVAFLVIAAQRPVDSPHRLLPVSVTRRQRRHALLLDERKRRIDAAIGKRHIDAPVRRLQDVGRTVVAIDAIHGADLTGGRRGGLRAGGGVHFRLAGLRIHRAHPR